MKKVLIENKPSFGETSQYNFSDDACDYDTNGFIKMGIAFAKPLKQLEGNCIETN